MLGPWLPSHSQLGVGSVGACSCERRLPWALVNSARTGEARVRLCPRLGLSRQSPPGSKLWPHGPCLYT